MTFSTDSSVSLVSPFTPLSQLASIPLRHLPDTESHMFSSSYQLDISEYLTDSSGFLGTSAPGLLTIVIEMFTSGWIPDFFKSKPVSKSNLWWSFSFYVLEKTVASKLFMVLMDKTEIPIFTSDTGKGQDYIFLCYMRGLIWNQCLLHITGYTWIGWVSHASKCILIKPLWPRQQPPLQKHETNAEVP